MLPVKLICNQCREEFPFEGNGGLNLYATTIIDPDGRPAVRDDDLLQIPQQPVWCHGCGAPRIAEDLCTLREWETAFAVVRSGRAIEYPFESRNHELQDAAARMSRYLELRQQRAGKVAALNAAAPTTSS